MPRLPVKKLRKQLKLLLLLVLLTFAVWFTYLHISLVRQGRALRLPFAYGRGKRAGGGRPPPQPGAAPGGPSRPITPRCGVSVEFGPPQGWWVPPAALGFQSIPQRRRHPAPAGEGPPGRDPRPNGSFQPPSPGRAWGQRDPAAGTSALAPAMHLRDWGEQRSPGRDPEPAGRFPFSPLERLCPRFSARRLGCGDKEGHL